MTVKNKAKNKKHERMIQRIIRVNHAGESGARRIYKGQLAILKNNKEIEHMYEQEVVHLDYFDKEMKERNVRPTLLSPLWHGFGFAMGAVTAVLGEKAAMACTVAVEEVIGEHYAEQEKYLREHNLEKELREKIVQFRDEELEHRDIGIKNDAENAVGYDILTKAIKSFTRAAIFLSKRI
jgi:ubiquinone biosynthesis monooxygenase Coq7